MAATKRQKKPQSDSRARGATPTKTAERVRTIVALMERIKWRPTDIPRLAKRWGISESRVKDLAAEASRFVKGAIGDPEDVRSEFVAAFKRLASDARHCKTTLVDAKGNTRTITKPDFNAATRALTEAAELLGLKKQRLEIELDADLDRKLGDLQGLVSPEVFHVVTSIFAGKGGQSPPRDGDGDAGGED